MVLDCVVYRFEAKEKDRRGLVARHVVSYTYVEPQDTPSPTHPDAKDVGVMVATTDGQQHAVCATFDEFHEALIDVLLAHSVRQVG